MAYLKENYTAVKVEEPDKRTAEELAYCRAKFFEGIRVEELDLCSRYILTILVTLHRTQGSYQFPQAQMPRRQCILTNAGILNM